MKGNKKKLFAYQKKDNCVHVLSKLRYVRGFAKKKSKKKMLKNQMNWKKTHQ